MLVQMCIRDRFEGYVDDDEIMMCDNIFNAMEKTEIERADVRLSLIHI